MLGLAFAPPRLLFLSFYSSGTSSTNPALFSARPEPPLALLRRARPCLLARSSDPDPAPELGPDADDPEPDADDPEADSGGFEIEVVTVEGERNRRRIQAWIAVDADLETVWGLLTDYEGLAGFIPSLAVSRLLDRSHSFARLYQVGEQNLALGLKFNAKGVIDCYEKEIERFPTGGRRRDIEFRMVEGDFRLFEGRWSIEQIDSEICEKEDSFEKHKFQTTLSYVVELEPKLWLPVQLLEGRLCREVKMNLMSVREEAQRVQKLGDVALPIL